MKILITCFVLFSIQIFSQTYLDISYNNGDPANSTDLSLLQKITFSGTDITFLLTDNSTVSKAFSIIDKFTFSETNGGNPLPVELTSFSALVNGSSVILNWRTETEVSNYGFEVERKMKDARSETWVKLGFVEGHGNSNSPKDYSFQDESPPRGTVQYRLKQIDTDGKFAYSDIITVGIGIPTKFELKQNFPNPFNPATNIVYNLPVDGFVALKVYDIIGNEVDVLVNENKKAGRYVMEFNGSNLSSGVYFCRISSGKYSALIKMMLIK